MIHTLIRYKRKCFMKLKTTIISSDKVEKKVYAEITREHGNTYSASLFLEDDKDKKKSLGEIAFSVEREKWTGACPPFLSIKIMHSMRPEYSHIGNALHECAFRFSHDSGCEGRIEIDASWASHYFHFKNNFRIPDGDTQEYSDRYYLRILEALLESNGRITKDLGSRTLHLPKQAIKEKYREYEMTDVPEDKEEDDIQDMTRGEAILGLYEQGDLVSAKILVAIYHTRSPSTNKAVDSIITEAQKKTLNKKHLFDTLINVLIDKGQVNEKLLAELQKHFDFTNEIIQSFRKALNQAALSSMRGGLDDKHRKMLNALLSEAIDTIPGSSNKDNTIFQKSTTENISERQKTLHKTANTASLSSESGHTKLTERNFEINHGQEDKSELLLSDSFKDALFNFLDNDNIDTRDGIYRAIKTFIYSKEIESFQHIYSAIKALAADRDRQVKIDRICETLLDTRDIDLTNAQLLNILLSISEPNKKFGQLLKSLHNIHIKADMLEKEGNHEDASALRSIGETLSTATDGFVMQYFKNPDDQIKSDDFKKFSDRIKNIINDGIKKSPALNKPEIIDYFINVVSAITIVGLLILAGTQNQRGSFWVNSNRASSTLHYFSYQSKRLVDNEIKERKDLKSGC